MLTTMVLGLREHGEAGFLQVSFIRSLGAQFFSIVRLLEIREWHHFLSSS